MISPDVPHLQQMSRQELENLFTKSRSGQSRTVVGTERPSPSSARSSGGKSLGGLTFLLSRENISRQARLFEQPNLPFGLNAIVARIQTRI